MQKDRSVINLTDKEKRFCEEYVIDFNGSRAATVAGYSKKSCGTLSSRLLEKVEVQSYLNLLRKKLQRSSKISAERVLNEFAKIGFANLQDYYNEGNNLKDITKLDRKKAAAIESLKIVKKSGGAGETQFETEEMTIKLNSKQSALESLGRHLALFTDNVNSRVTMDVTEATQFSIVPKKLKQTGGNTDPLGLTPDLNPSDDS